MKAVILAGGLGTRLSEETHLKPKPMVEVGRRPILWHIMKLYSHYGINEFIICAGYRSYVIKEYFANYMLHMSDVTFDMNRNTMEVCEKRSEPWKVTVVDTGQETMTGGRLKRVRDYLGDDTFCFTYGDGVGDVDIAKTIEIHRSAGRKATLTAVQPPGRYGALCIDGNRITQFQEKPEGDGAWINGGFFVLEPSVIDYIDDDSVSWERAPLEGLAEGRELSVYKHYGFWRPMDTLRDKLQLEAMWDAEKAPWKLW
ncbi:MAG: glucose-1-phosphate cytidylyltransferase [Lentimonas sp.]